jgi:hypothetical protein
MVINFFYYKLFFYNKISTAARKILDTITPIRFFVVLFYKKNIEVIFFIANILSSYFPENIYLFIYLTSIIFFINITTKTF